SSPGVGGTAGIHRPILNPVTGLLGASAEATLEGRVGMALGGLRLMGTMPALGFSAGVDWQDRYGLAPILTFQTAVRRGGIVGRGTMLRLDWLPGSRQALDVGVKVPLMQRFAGRT